MDERLLNCFVKVYEYGSIHKAAEKLFVTPQAVSKMIKKLEEELGKNLFTRSAMGLTPTIYAQRLYSSSNIILSECSRIRGEFMEESINTVHMLHIATTFGVPRFLSLKFIMDFYEMYPDIHLDLVEYPEYPIHNMLESGRVDFAFLPQPIDLINYEVIFCFSHDFRALVNVNHPLAQKNVIRYKDLNGCPIVLKGRDFSLYPHNITRFVKGGLNPEILLEISDDSLIVDAARQNWGVGISATFLAEEYIDSQVKAIPFEDETFVRNVFLVHRREQKMSRTQECFWNFTTEWLEKNRENLSLLHKQKKKKM